MTYFEFLLLFLTLPTGALAGWIVLGRRRQQPVTTTLRRWPFPLATLLHSLIALIYTTPWDNYLVATGVWWYDESLVTGLTIGWVPIEEYTFFVLQPILAGLWIAALALHVHPGSVPRQPLRSSLRWWLSGVVAGIWLVALLILLKGWLAGNYLGLELVWALPPIALQLGFGADILWRHRRLVSLSITSLTAYLAAADALAINSGTWTISPDKSLGILLGGVLPLEELIFFLLTNTLITFGIVLISAPESGARLAASKLLLRLG